MNSTNELTKCWKLKIKIVGNKQEIPHIARIKLKYKILLQRFVLLKQAQNSQHSEHSGYVLDNSYSARRRHPPSINIEWNYAEQLDPHERWQDELQLVRTNNESDQQLNSEPNVRDIFNNQRWADWVCAAMNDIGHGSEHYVEHG
jgi:hypothetical protein